MVELIVSSYVTGNKLDAGQLPELIETVYSTLASPGSLSETANAPAVKLTASQIKNSITPAALISFIDGKQYSTLKCHLTANGMNPTEYRAHFGLPADYPMVSPNYSAHRSAMAKRFGLGTKSKTPTL